MRQKGLQKKFFPQIFYYMHLKKNYVGMNIALIHPMLVNKKTFSSLYFVGIGGIGMSAIARFFHQQGCKIYGYDRTPTPLTQQLSHEGMVVEYEEQDRHLPTDIDAVIYTPAIPSTHAALVWYRDKDFPILKRSDILAWITYHSFNICVAGTHGKTTTTTLLSHILRDTGFGCNAFLGGISTNYNTNFWASDTEVSVIEADEYDRSFLKLSPDIAIITSIEADHLDIYGNVTEVENAFFQFSQQIKTNGCLIYKYGIIPPKPWEAAHVISYHLNNKQADVYSDHVYLKDGVYYFDIIAKEWQLKDMQLKMGGMHNIENTLAACTVAIQQLHIDPQKVQRAVASFKGVKRRFEIVLHTKQVILVDDYAHHPTELQALLNGARCFFVGQKILLVFQPHLYSRTKDFAKEFAHVLDQADESVLLPLYPAREVPIQGVDSAYVASYMTKSAHLFSLDQLKDWILLHKPSLILMAGAGNIDALVYEMKDWLLSTYIIDHDAEKK